MQNAPKYRRQTVRVSDGLALNVREWDGQGTTCVMIHGLADGAFVWDSFAEKIAGRCRILALDLRGHGDSDWSPQKLYNFDEYVLDVLAVFDDLNLKECVLVGHSLGGSIVARLMQLRPVGILGSVLVDSGPLPDLEVRKLIRERVLESYKSYRLVEEYAAYLRETQPLANAEEIRKLAVSSLAPTEDDSYRLKFDVGVVDILCGGYDESWWWPALKGFQSPVQVVRGRGSAAFPQRVAEQMVQHMTDARLAVIELAGHAVMRDNSDGFFNSVAPFILKAKS